MLTNVKIMKTKIQGIEELKMLFKREERICRRENCKHKKIDKN